MNSTEKYEAFMARYREICGDDASEDFAEEWNYATEFDIWDMIDSQWPEYRVFVEGI